MMMDPALIPLLTTAAAEALKTWGSYTIVLIVLGVMHWRSTRREATKDEEIKLLRDENKSLQEKRLEDAQKLIRITEAGTATMQSRSQSDQVQTDALNRLATLMTELQSIVQGQPRRRSSR